ncbi:prepilin-type N-terminal cleavage/methylation domain-containing protein [Eubacterium ruminantium]|nr:prepilin-type N-terminal cleavage/methylation domain-containing protein [Eubacterium ruminantium]
MAKKKNSGFSLIEVVIAVAILGLLITPILTQIVQTSNTSRKAKERQAAVENAEYVTNFIQRTDKSELDSSSSAGVKDINITAYTKKQDVFCKLVDSDGNAIGTTVKYNAYIYDLDNIKLGPKLNEYTRQAILDDLSNSVLASGYSIVYDNSLYTDAIKSKGYKLTNEGSIVKYDGDGLVSEIMCTPYTSSYTYVNPNKVSLGFIQDLDSTKVAIIQGIASNFDAQVSEDIFAEKMNTLRDNDIDEWNDQVGSQREDGENVFSNDETACRLLYISIRAIKNGSDEIQYYEVTCDACYYDKYKIKGNSGTAKFRYNVFAKKFYTTKSPDIYLVYEPYVPDESEKAYAYNDYIEVYNDADTKDSKLYLIKPTNNQLKGTDYVEAAGDTKRHYNTKNNGEITPVNINIQVALKDGEEATTKDLMMIYTNLDVNYTLDGHNQFSTNDLIRKSNGGDGNGDDITRDNLAELRKMPWPDYIVKSDRLPASKLKHVSEDTNTADRLFTVTVYMKPVSGSMDAVRYTAGKGVD